MPMPKERKGPERAEGLLQEGILAKEKKNFGSAASYFTEAIIFSQENGYPHGVLHGLLNMGTIWSLKAQATGMKAFTRLAKITFLQAQDYAREEHMQEEEVMHTTYLLAQAEYDLGDFSKAVDLYRQVYGFHATHPFSKARTGDVQRHLGIALIKAGSRQEGIAALDASLAAIRTYDEKDAFDKRNYVWEAGALLALSVAYSATDPGKAQEYAKEALTVAMTHDLTIRKEEAEKQLQ